MNWELIRILIDVLSVLMFIIIIIVLYIAYKSYSKVAAPFKAAKEMLGGGDEEDENKDIEEISNEVNVF